MPAPKPLPSFHDALRIKAVRDIPEGLYPCTECWGAGCDRCGGSGYSSRFKAFRWYRMLQRRYEEERRAWDEQLDEEGKNVVGKDYYDLDLLRRIGKKG